MSSRTPEQTQPDRPWSLTARLTLFYTVCTFVVLAVSAGLLYEMLAHSIAKEQRHRLSDTVQVLRSILAERPDALASLEEEVTWETQVTKYARYYLRILDERGRVLIETPGKGSLLKQAPFPPPAPVGALPKTVRTWTSPNGKPFALTSAWAAGRAPGQRHVIQIALNTTRDTDLLSDYLEDLAAVVVLGTLLSAGIGLLIVRRGLRPLNEITGVAQRITADRLHERVERARWPRELKTLATAFDEMLVRLEDSFARLSQFSADIAHELRTPINNLMGEAEVALSRSRTSDEYRQVLESSIEECRRLSRLVEELLFLARADRAETRIERVELDARRELQAVREFHELVASEKSIAVTCEGGAILNADPILFRRAVSNLLSNALQYTPSGGEVTLSAANRADGSTEITVRDTGIGIAPEHLPKIFDRFYRGDPARSGGSQGTGLGLAIVKSIMSLHGGAVTAQSTPGQGTTVTLVFPPHADGQTPRPPR